MKNLFILFVFSTSVTAMAQQAGSLDPAFGTGGKVVTSISSGEDKAYGTALQTDGKIVVAGFSTSGVTGKDFTVVRYNADGSLDATFGTGGIVTTDVQTGSEDYAYSVALQSDGKIVLAGSSDDGSDKNAAIVRYKTDGVIDSTFGVNGIVLTDFDSNHADELKVVKIHALTGNIIVGGSSQINTSTSKPVIARYLADGTIDSTFNSTGIRLLWITSLDYQYLFSLEDLIVQTNGKISAVGWRDFPGLSWDSDYWACRVNSDGTMDNTFSTDGVSTYDGNFNGHDRAYAMVLQSGNNILMAGGGYESTLYYDMTLLQLTLGGTSAGLIPTDFGSTKDDIAYALAADADGNYVLAGSSLTATTGTFALTRLTSSGAADATFGTAGKVTTTFGTNTVNGCFDMFIQPDNKIVAAGCTGNDFAVARYLGYDQAQLDAFTLVSPANNAVNQNYATLAFDWTDAFGATSYTLELDTDNGFPNPATYSATTSAKTVTNLLPNTHYYWRVKASDGTNTGAYSTVWSFTTNTLENFVLVSPVNNAVNQPYASLVFNWSDAVGASSYQIEYDVNSAFTGSPQQFSATPSTYTATNLSPATDYFWHVRALNGTTPGNWSQVWKLTTIAQSGAGLNEIQGAEIAVFPNPATEQITLAAPTALAGKGWTIADNSGKIVLNGTITSETTTIAVNRLSPGIYFLGAEGTPAVKIVKD